MSKPSMLPLNEMAERLEISPGRLKGWSNAYSYPPIHRDGYRLYISRRHEAILKRVLELIDDGYSTSGAFKKLGLYRPKETA